MANPRPVSYVPELAADYLQSLLRGQITAAKDRIQRIVRTPNDLEKVYLEIFMPVQHEIGRMWEQGEISLVDEHLMTAVTLELMNELSAVIFSRDTDNPRVLVTTAPGDLHDLGARVIADLMEMRGWDATQLSSPSSPDEVLDALDRGPYDLLVVSATLPTSVRRTRTLLRLVKGRGEVPLCLVAGRALEAQPQLALSIGADASPVDVTLLSGQALRLLRRKAGSYAGE